MATNYVIACWSGMRRVNPPKYMSDRAVFLRAHLESLKKLKHTLGQITIVVSENKDEPADYRRFLKGIPNEIQGAKVVILERPNVGYSYGGYSDVFERYGEKFDYYLLMEDDYLFLEDHFDRTMRDRMERETMLGYLSFSVRQDVKKTLMNRARKVVPGGNLIAENMDRYTPDVYRYPLVCVGLMRTATLRAMWDAFGQLPYSKFLNHLACKLEGQFGISVAVQKVGWEVGDMLPQYRVRAFGPGGEIMDMGPKESPLFLTAIQPLAT